MGLTPRRGERGGYAKGISRRCGEWFSTPWKGAAPTEAPTGVASGEGGTWVRRGVMPEIGLYAGMYYLCR